jgi:RsiW-degrading membrane proteinase PrsW (M82 family)
MESFSLSIFSFLLFSVVGAVLSFAWVGIVNALLIHTQKIKSIEKNHPYIPSAKVIAGTLLSTAIVFALSVFYGYHSVLAAEQHSGILGLGGLFLGCTFVCLAFEQRFQHAKEYVFSLSIGSGCALVLLGFQRTLFGSGITHDPSFIALAFVCVIIAWRLLFGPWSPHVKATVLGTFIFWIAIVLLLQDPPNVRLARTLAGVVAIIPAFIWCSFFLQYHMQRQSMVALMFFAGMISTAPILFYDKLVRSGGELQFFFFRVVPENFNSTSSAFVTGNILGVSPVQSTLLVTLISFLFVGFIEELSKFWVLRRSGRRFFSSIDDAMQLSIIVAIGFAFAENVLNPSYFMGFVHAYVLHDSPNWGAFVGNVVGRAVLTNMVHIVATGVLGYFCGLALFAGPVLQHAHKNGKFFLLADGLHALLGLSVKTIYRVQMLATGLFFAILLHGFFNFLVTFPDLLPNNPRTFGQLFGFDFFFVSNIPILLVPALFYVVGGCWLLTELFYRKESMKEYGHIVTTDAFITDSVVA